METFAPMKTKRPDRPQRQQAPANARVARSARYDAETERMVFELDNGAAVAIPRAAIRGLKDVDSALVANFVLEEYGLGIEWPDLEVSFSIPEMLPELALERHV
jgi:uncharacterized protein DUF2442